MVYQKLWIKASDNRLFTVHSLTRTFLTSNGPGSVIVLNKNYFCGSEVNVKGVAGGINLKRTYNLQTTKVASISVHNKKYQVSIIILHFIYK